MVGPHYISCEHTIKRAGVKIKGEGGGLGCSLRHTIPHTFTYSGGSEVAPVSMLSPAAEQGF